MSTSHAAMAPPTHRMDADNLIVQLARWASRVCFADIPPGTVVFARSQLISNLATVRASLTHPLGDALVKAFGRRDKRIRSSRLTFYPAWRCVWILTKWPTRATCRHRV